MKQVGVTSGDCFALDARANRGSFFEMHFLSTVNESRPDLKIIHQANVGVALFVIARKCFGHGDVAAGGGTWILEILMYSDF